MNEIIQLIIFKKNFSVFYDKIFFFYLLLNIDSGYFYVVYKFNNLYNYFDVYIHLYFILILLPFIYFLLYIYNILYVNNSYTYYVFFHYLFNIILKSFELFTSFLIKRIIYISLFIFIFYNYSHPNILYIYCFFVQPPLYFSYIHLCRACKLLLNFFNKIFIV